MDKTKITAETLARTVVLLLALLNQLFSVFGLKLLEIESSDIYQAISLIFTFAAAAAAWWKNNSFTHAAIRADEYLAELREEENK